MDLEIPALIQDKLLNQAEPQLILVLGHRESLEGI